MEPRLDYLIRKMESFKDWLPIQDEELDIYNEVIEELYRLKDLEK